MTARLRAYLVWQLPFILGVAIAIAAFGVATALLRSDIRVFTYASQVILFFALIYLGVRFISFKKEESAKEQLEQLQYETRQKEAEYAESRAELLAYFLLWVHQMKTPITAAKLLAEDAGTDRRDDIRLELVRIEGYANMAMNYLKLTDPTADLEFADVALDDILRGLFKHFSLFFIHGNVRLDYAPTHAMVLTDGKWLRVLIEQILSNAVKYTKEGEVSVSWDAERQELVIADTGIGIHARDLPKIFDRGYSGTNGRLHEKSTGLGLFLAQSIANRLGHTIHVASEVGHGTTVRIGFQPFKNVS